MKDLVVLKRNDRKDANVIQDGDIPCLYDLYLTDDKELYFYHCGKEKWILSNLNGDQDYYNLLKPIKEEVMKEYLVKTDSGSYLYTKNVSDIAAERVIEVPDGANVYARCNIFGDYKWLPKIIDGEWSVLWQRHTQPEELPFMDDNKPWAEQQMDRIMGRESLNDQYTEIEQVRQQSIEATLAERQAQYGSFVGVANTTGALMAVIKNSKNGSTLPYAHEEALHMICSKIARIVNGDHNHKDSWHDIGGYSKLIEDLL